jgi:hypothetical protein
MQRICEQVFSGLNMASHPDLALARRLESIALSDEYFIKRKLYPNVDFYSGIVLRALGIPTDMFTWVLLLGGGCAILSSPLRGEYFLQAVVGSAIHSPFVAHLFHLLLTDMFNGSAGLAGGYAIPKPAFT